MHKPLVSIIIPCFNRADIITETLDSVLSQTYTNWECIIINDESVDRTKEVVTKYCNKDSRIKLYDRPLSLKKGANSCRNYGLEISKGIYINWFDSDDLMHETFIKKKVEILEGKKLDFVISNSINFDDKGNESPIFDVDNVNKEITAVNYICNIINWITMDVMVRKESIGSLRFNEFLKSGQEYNFFSRYLLGKPKGEFIQECLARRRVHANSIQQLLQKDSFKEKELLFNEIVLLKDIKGKVSKLIIKRSLKRMIRFNYETQKAFTVSKVQFVILKELINFGEIKSIFCYLMWVKFNFILGKGYFWIKLSN